MLKGIRLDAFYIFTWMMDAAYFSTSLHTIAIIIAVYAKHQTARHLAISLGVNLVVIRIAFRYHMSLIGIPDYLLALFCHPLNFLT